MFIWIPGLHFGVYNIVSWIIIGLLAGFLASKVVRGRGYGCLGDTIIGLIGAVVGGFLASLLGFGGGFGFVGTLVIAFLGAVLFLWLLHALAGDSRR
jgi:uncharacterized membrane protein YeaQ/YmgE (transglycosylase-associated protein family)